MIRNLTIEALYLVATALLSVAEAIESNKLIRMSEKVAALAWRLMTPEERQQL